MAAIISTHAVPADTDKDQSNLNNNYRSGGGGGGGYHPFIEGLLTALPKNEGPWAIEKQAKWLQAAAQIFGLIYSDDASVGRIEVKIQKES